jgi:hypothetical protein
MPFALCTTDLRDGKALKGSAIPAVSRSVVVSGILGISIRMGFSWRN